MKQVKLILGKREKLSSNVYRIQLFGDVSAITAPGQFIDLKIQGYFLRRPISVYDSDGDSVSVIYKVVGKGTEALTELPIGTPLDVLTGLGNGYDVTLCGDAPLLLGGGSGVPPMYYLAKQLIAKGIKPSVILGFNTKDEVFCEEEFRRLGADVTVTTVDGSYDQKGFVTDALPDGYTYFYTCGPEAMLKAVFRETKTSGQFSFEERMGCGFGACMGCTCKTVTGYKRICKDGPVLKKEEILW